MSAMWVKEQWENSNFGDSRLNDRAIKIGQACLEKPNGTLPKKCTKWADLKGAYRFFDSDKISHESLQEAHNKNTLAEATKVDGVALFIQDGSEIEYNDHPWTCDLGPTSDSYGQGIMIHTCLAVAWNEGIAPEVLGLAKQTPWIRPTVKDPKEKTKESKVWLDMLKAIGPKPMNCKWITVGDRASDIYNFLHGATELDWDYIIRTHYDRKLSIDDETQSLRAWVSALEPQAKYDLVLRGRGNKSVRTVEMSVAYGKALINPPYRKSGIRLPVNYVRTYSNEDPSLEWILVTSLDVNTPEDAIQIVQMYKERWVIEEYHKCLKTGCQIEKAQLRNGDRLLNLLGILGVIATQLLRLRDRSRQDPDCLAAEVVGDDELEVIKKLHKLKDPVTLKEFWRRVAMLGGFIGRKSDGNPGWQTIWSGWLELQAIVKGLRLARTCG